MIDCFLNFKTKIIKDTTKIDFHYRRLLFLYLYILKADLPDVELYIRNVTALCYVVDLVLTPPAVTAKCAVKFLTGIFTNTLSISAADKYEVRGNIKCCSRGKERERRHENDARSHPVRERESHFTRSYYSSY